MNRSTTRSVPSNPDVPIARPVEPSQGEAVDHLSLISLPTAASSAGVLLFIAAWFVAIFAIGLWGIRAASDSGTVSSPLMTSMASGDVALSRVCPALGLSASLTLASVVLAMIITWVRPLRSLVRATTLLIQGQWHRPIPQSLAAIAPVQQLAVIYEDLRRSLVDRLRSSTELNLQLESEVARRTAELDRRNVELAALLTRLESTRAELLRNQKLATVGRIASDVAGSIAAPMQRLVQLSQQIGEDFDGLLASTHMAPPAGDSHSESTITGATAGAIAVRLASLDDRLGQLIASAAQAGEVVRALRVYARPDTSHHPNAYPDLAPLTDRPPTADHS